MKPSALDIYIFYAFVFSRHTDSSIYIKKIENNTMWIQYVNVEPFTSGKYYVSITIHTIDVAISGDIHDPRTWIGSLEIDPNETSKSIRRRIYQLEKRFNWPWKCMGPEDETK